jgi:uncharacterized membrane protein YdjX (TVP38/TMEM64 family)
MKTRASYYAVLLVLAAALIATGRYLHATGLFDPTKMQAYLHQKPVVTACLFVAFYAVCMLSFVPTLPLNLAAGLLWGGLPGGILTTLGATLGAVAAFVLARTLLGQLLVERFRWELPDRVKNGVERLGWRAVAFCRLNPAIPTCVVNYAFGVTSLPLRTYAWATFVFFLPATLAIAVIGDQTQTFIVGSSATGLINATVATLTAVALLLGIAWVVRLPRNAVKQEG